jgi:hypothetical protein
MSSRVTFPQKLVGETSNLQFDFISLLGATETLSSYSVAATVYTGVDASPGSLVSGAASASGSVVTQAITGGVAGVIYCLVCTAVTSASQTLELAGMLAVLPNSI